MWSSGRDYVVRFYLKILEKNMASQVSRTRFSILPDFKYPVVYLVSTLLLFPIFPRFFFFQILRAPFPVHQQKLESPLSY